MSERHFEPPYYVAVFKTEVYPEKLEEYRKWAALMMEEVQKSPGFLGVDAVRDAEGRGITVSYWRTREDIKTWGRNPAHRKAQEIGKREFYRSLNLEVSHYEGP